MTGTAPWNDASCGSIETRPRSALTRARVRRRGSRSSRRLALRKSAATLNSVVFPAPFGPRRPNSAPVGTSNETRSSASTWRPNHFVSSWQTTALRRTPSQVPLQEVARAEEEEERDEAEHDRGGEADRAPSRDAGGRVRHPQGVSRSSQSTSPGLVHQLRVLDQRRSGRRSRPGQSASAPKGEATLVLIHVQSARYGRLNRLSAAQP